GFRNSGGQAHDVRSIEKIHTEMPAGGLRVYKFIGACEFAVRPHPAAVPTSQADFLLLRKRGELPPYAELGHIVKRRHPLRVDTSRFVMVSRQPQNFPLHELIGDHVLLLAAISVLGLKLTRSYVGGAGSIPRRTGFAKPHISSGKRDGNAVID